MKSLSMALQLFGFHTHTHDFAVSKTCSSWEDCSFLLDFARPLKRIRWLGARNSWFGPTVALLVPVIHTGQRVGGFVVGVSRNDAQFRNIQKLWKLNYKSARELVSPKIDNLQIIAAFGQHFPEDC